MPGATWKFVLANHWNEQIGEILNAYDRRVTLPINNIRSLSLKVRLDNPLTDSMILNAANTVKAYRDGTLMFHGPIWSVEENGDATGAYLTVNCVGPEKMLWYRLTRTTNPNFSNLTDADFTTASADRGTYLANLAGLQPDELVDTTTPTSVGQTITNYTLRLWQTYGEVLVELAEGGYGFDWVVEPLDPTPVTNHSNSGPRIGRLKTYGSLGSSKTNAVFEWGTGTRANITSYRKGITRENQALAVYWHGIAATFLQDDPAETTKWGEWQTAITGMENLSETDRSGLANTHYDVRRLPQQTIEITPHIDPAATGRLPYYGTDYSIGDTVRVRAVYGKSVRFDAMLRVYEANFEIDAAGVEKVSLTVSAPVT